MLKLTNIMVGSGNVAKMIEFYTKVIGRDGDMVDEVMAGWNMDGFFFAVAAHSEVQGESKEPQRVLFNFETEDVEGEFNRIKEFAQVVKAPYQMGPEGNQAWIATLADPDGNYFQLMTPWKE